MLGYTRNTAYDVIIFTVLELRPLHNNQFAFVSHDFI